MDAAGMDPNLKQNPYSPNWWRLGGDLTAATTSALLVSPTITIIDRALVEKASYNKPLLQTLRAHSLAALRHPSSFLFSKPHAHVFTLYAATYTVANSTETITKKAFPSSADAITFAATFLVNVPLGVWKDIRFAHFFGSKQASLQQQALPQTGPLQQAKGKPVPLPQTGPLQQAKGKPVPLPKTGSGSRAATLTLLIRDAVTIYGSFTLAQQCADIIPDSLASHSYSKTVFTQLVVPVLSQLVATPLHLLGLDLYNRQYRVPVRERVGVVMRDLPSATVIRCVRIVPAFGVGCLVNMGLRSAFHGVG